MVASYNTKFLSNTLAKNERGQEKSHERKIPLDISMLSWYASVLKGSRIGSAMMIETYVTATYTIVLAIVLGVALFAVLFFWTRKQHPNLYGKKIPLRFSLGRDIKAGDFVFCLGDGIAIFPVASVDKEHGTAFLNPAVYDIGTGGNESLHKLELVRDSEHAERFPQFC